MRRPISVIGSTALEMLSEPLTLLVLLAALVMSVLAPAFHYHQFGESTRMARDAGFSALFTCGAIVAVCGTIRSFRREVESGTLAMALARPVSRTVFFLSKAVGAFAACLVVALVIFLTSLVIVDGAAIGGEVSRQTGSLARIWGPSLVQGVAVIILPLVIAAALNRFGRFRFVLSSVLLSLLLAGAFAAYAATHALGLFVRLVPVAVLLVLLTSVWLTAAAAFAIRFGTSVATASVGVVLVLSLPTVGNYYLSNALVSGGMVPWSYVGWAALATLPAVALFLGIGISFVNGRDFA